MDCAKVFIVLLGIHTGCHGIYEPPVSNPTYGICTLNVDQKITTIPVTETKHPTPITETMIIPAVTSYMDMAPITDTFTVIEWNTQPPKTILVPLPPVTSSTTDPCFTSVTTIACTTTEKQEPIIETSTRKVIRQVPGMVMISTVFLTSTVTQPMATKTITLGEVTSTKTLPPHSNYVTTTIVSTVIGAPKTTTVTSKWIMTKVPEPVIVKHPAKVHHPSPHSQHVTITIPTTIYEPHSTVNTTIETISISCTTTYSYAEPNEPWKFNSGGSDLDLGLPNEVTPARPITFIHHVTAPPNPHYDINERDGITEHPFDDNDYGRNTQPSF